MFNWWSAILIFVAYLYCRRNCLCQSNIIVTLSFRHWILVMMFFMKLCMTWYRMYYIISAFSKHYFAALQYLTVFEVMWLLILLDFINGVCLFPIACIFMWQWFKILWECRYFRYHSYMVCYNIMCHNINVSYLHIICICLTICICANK